MLERITLNLSSKERQALQSIAEVEMRNFREQARYIIRQELERRGYLTSQEHTESTNLVKENQLKEQE